MGVDEGVDVAVSRRRGARASSLDAERRATLARLSRAAKRVDLKSLRGVRPRARERGARVARRASIEAPSVVLVFKVS